MTTHLFMTSQTDLWSRKVEKGAILAQNRIAENPVRALVAFAWPLDHQKAFVGVFVLKAVNVIFLSLNLEVFYKVLYIKLKPGTWVTS